MIVSVSEGKNEHAAKKQWRFDLDERPNGVGLLVRPAEAPVTITLRKVKDGWVDITINGITLCESDD
jgi:hypothetical protein